MITFTALTAFYFFLTSTGAFAVAVALAKDAR